ncbi:MAG: DUF2177 family protein [Proteobacteria bacterium]|nr:DUF2177 family protein [Pseudomonadota bacterium]
MSKWLVGYVGAGAAFVLLDLTWLNLMTPVIYRPAIGHLLAERFHTGAAVAFYLAYIAGIVIFGLRPGFQAHSVVTALLWGTVFGLAAYATYDLTNMATLKDWPLKLTIVDMAWGGFASAVAAAAGYLAATAFGEV